MTWEDREVDWAFKVIKSLLSGLQVSLADTLTEEDHGATRTTERLVGRGSDNIGMLERTWDDTSSDETGDMSHVNHKIGTNKICNLPHALIVNQTAVCRCACNKNLGSVHQGICFKGIVVNDASLEIDTVWESFKVGRDGGDSIL